MVVEVARGELSRPARLASRGGAYLRLGKADVPDYWLALPIGVVAVTPAATPRTVAVALLLWIFVASGYASAVALDDVQGAHDGSDNRNYAPDDGLRRRARKPLLDNQLTKRQALRFAALVMTVGIGCGITGFVLAPHRPVWVLICGLAVFALGTQYSAGLKLSYLMPGGAEFLLFLSMFATAGIPAYLFARTPPFAALWLQAAAMGLLMVAVGACSNGNDMDGDRAAGRRTVAVLLSTVRYRIYALAIATVSLIVSLCVAPTYRRPWLLILLLLPAIAMKARQLQTLRSPDWLAARRAGFMSMRLAAAGFITASLLTPQRPW